MCERRIGAETDGRKDLEAAFPHLQQDKIRSQAGKELIAIYSSTGEPDKAQAIRDELAKNDQTMAQEPGQNQMTTSESGALSFSAREICRRFGLPFLPSASKHLICTQHTI